MEERGDSLLTAVPSSTKYDVMISDLAFISEQSRRVDAVDATGSSLGLYQLTDP